jgi:hypothetical protein
MRVHVRLVGWDEKTRAEDDGREEGVAAAGIKENKNLKKGRGNDDEQAPQSK